MTAILVVLTIAIFLSVDLWRTRAQRRASFEAKVPAPVFDLNGFSIPKGLFLGRGHTWARLESDGSILMGIDELANALVGTADRIQVAAGGTDLSSKDAAFVMHRGGKNLAFAAPVAGRVTEVNETALRHPEQVHETPYEDGWLLRLQPQQLGRGLSTLLLGDDAREWLRYEVKRIGDFVARQVPDVAVGTSMADGGLPVTNVLDRLDAAAWQRFEHEFLMGV